MQNQNNEQTTKPRYINGVKAYYKAGVWYADYNQYVANRAQQGIKTNIEVFCSWCDRFDLVPTG